VFPCKKRSAVPKNVRRETLCGKSRRQGHTKTSGGSGRDRLGSVKTPDVKCITRRRGRKLLYALKNCTQQELRRLKRLGALKTVTLGNRDWKKPYTYSHLNGKDFGKNMEGGVQSHGRHPTKKVSIIRGSHQNAQAHKEQSLEGRAIAPLEQNMRLCYKEMYAVGGEYYKRESGKKHGRATGH